MNRISISVAGMPAASPLLFNTVATLLEERKSFGDRRRMPNFSDPHCHTLTDRRAGAERRHDFLNKEVFNRRSQS